MAGKSTNIKVEKSRFKEAFKVRGISEKRLGKMLEDVGILTYRQLQRNLHDGYMNERVLVECARILDVDIYYLTGEISLPVSDVIDRYTKDNEFMEYVKDIPQIDDLIMESVYANADSNGISLANFIDYPSFKNSYDLFLAWIKVDHEINIYEAFTHEQDIVNNEKMLDIYDKTRDYVNGLLSSISKDE